MYSFRHGPFGDMITVDKLSYSNIPYDEIVMFLTKCRWFTININGNVYKIVTIYNDDECAIGYSVYINNAQLKICIDYQIYKKLITFDGEQYNINDATILTDDYRTLDYIVSLYELVGLKMCYDV